MFKQFLALLLVCCVFTSFSLAAKTQTGYTVSEQVHHATEILLAAHNPT